MKKKILLNLSCLCMLFGCGNTTECVAMNSGKIADLSTLRSLNRNEHQTILKVCDLDPTNGVSLKETYRGKRGFEDAIKKIQNQYKAKKESDLKTWINAEIAKQKNRNEGEDEDERHGNKLKEFSAIQATTVMIGGQEVALQVLVSEKYNKREFESNNEKKAAKKAIEDLIKKEGTYTSKCIETLRQCLNNLPGVQVHDEEHDNELLKFTEVENREVEIGGQRVTLKALAASAGEYDEHKFGSTAEKEAAKKVIQELIETENVYSNECIDTLRQCLNKLPGVQVHDEEENKDQVTLKINELRKKYKNEQDVTVDIDRDTDTRQQFAGVIWLGLQKKKKEGGVYSKYEKLLAVVSKTVILNKFTNVFTNKEENEIFADLTFALEAFGVDDSNIGSSTATIKLDETGQFTYEKLLKDKGKNSVDLLNECVNMLKEESDAFYTDIVEAIKNEDVKKGFESMSIDEIFEKLGLSDKSDE